MINKGDKMQKTVFVTGGARGIGLETAKLFKKMGYNVIIGYFSSEEKAKEIELEYKIKAVKCDVRNVLEIENAKKIINKEYGRVDTLINCAGVSLKQATISQVSVEEYKNVFAVNVDGTFNSVKVFLTDMLALGVGVIVNVSSIWGLDGGSCEVCYSASKGAVTSMTKSLAKELSLSNIRVNEVVPGLIDTDMNAHLSIQEKQDFCQNVLLQRVGKAEEVAKAIYFLASENSSYITGQSLRVDGGLI